MKVLIRGLLTTVMVITIFLLCSCTYVKQIINDEIISHIGRETFTTEISDSIESQMPEIDEQKKQEIKDLLDNNEQLNNIVDTISERIVADLSKDEIENIDINDDIKTFLQENKDLFIGAIGDEISEEEIDRAIDEAISETDFNQVYRDAVKSVQNDMDQDVQTVLDVYNYITSQEFLTILIIVFVVAMAITFLLQKPHYKGIVNVSIATIVSAVLVVPIALIMNMILQAILEEIDTAIALNANPIWMSAGCLLAIGILLLIVNYLIEQKKKEVAQ
ncbi:MAG TPA: hypothetical protein IAC85_04710 [Candidatus Faecenecus gallistercoris]|uniref:Uncharacterized protein n=1 Tax=Candidatus Faecenecus gallistercoris TaxID=2840793 RepID=A0A9D0YZV8_9FIRM|nr:putative uncharacterized protein [Bacillus sp. CAG:988]HIQ65022.1 hypothetical protein [Candidatus Faecenecus gallistercoris]